MTRLYLAIFVSIMSTPWMAIESSAQSGFRDMEAFCSKHPTHPACSSIMSEYCALNPDDPACMSDDDDDDDSSAP
jgi:hypothetical protein